MDFLSLFLLYVIFVGVCVILMCKGFGSSQNFPRILLLAGQAFSSVLPEWMQRSILSKSHKLFNSRNRFFIILHVIVEFAVFGEYALELHAYCSELEFSQPHLLLPYVLGAVNLGLFWLCCITDPGTITASNHASCVQVYKYDELLFQKDKLCATCHFIKPARSKHCAVCDRCVQKFDHHCVWMNNCIGAHNTGYFLAYLITLTVLAVDLAVITTAFLAQVVFLSNMLMGSYLDGDGQEHAVDMLFVIQHLFLTFPRIVFMLGFLVVLFLLIGSYSCFMLCLLLRNQTSNEWCKARARGCLQGLPRHHVIYQNIYSRGMLQNVKEVFQPVMVIKEKDK